MNLVPNRVVIYSKDVVNITGLSRKVARRLLALIRKQCNKERTGFITIEEFAKFTGISEDLIRPFLI